MYDVSYYYFLTDILDLVRFSNNKWRRLSAQSIPGFSYFEIYSIYFNIFFCMNKEKNQKIEPDLTVITCSSIYRCYLELKLEITGKKNSWHLTKTTARVF